MTRTLRLTAGAVVLATSLLGCTDAAGPGGAGGPATSSAPTTLASSPSPVDGATFPSFLLDATIPELQRAMRTGRTSAVELVDFYLARIAAYDDAGPALSAILTVNPDARDEAAALDTERAASGPRGPLHGIPVVVKDNIDTAGMPTTGGALALEDFVPARDAFQVRRLRDAGAIILAKANLAELAQSWKAWSSLGGQSRNPYDPGHEPGGSSSGTAVAVTANFATVGLGTDTCGSNRLPAALGNLYGLRPSSGRSSRSGVIPFSSTLDEVGPMARTVRDLAIVLDATAGEDPADPTTVPLRESFVDALDAGGLRGRRIGVVTLSASGSFEYDVAMDGLVQDALDLMERQGAALVRVALPGKPHDVLIEFMGEFPYALRAYLAAEPTAPPGALAELLEQDPDHLAAHQPRTAAYRNALATRRSIRRQVERLMDRLDLDAIVYPATPTTALPIDEAAPPGESPSTGHWECAEAAVGGLPALTVPVGVASDGLPVGMELLGRRFDEATLLAIAAGYEAHTDHRVLPSATPALGGGS